MTSTRRQHTVYTPRRSANTLKHAGCTHELYLPYTQFMGPLSSVPRPRHDRNVRTSLYTILLHVFTLYIIVLYFCILNTITLYTTLHRTPLHYTRQAHTFPVPLSTHPIHQSPSHPIYSLIHRYVSRTVHLRTAKLISLLTVPASLIQGHFSSLHT